MPFNVELAAQYVGALPALEAWYRTAANETTDIGVDHTGIRGIGTGHRGDSNGPLTAYNAWANAQLVKLIRGGWDIALFASLSSFETWHALLLESVEAYWEMRGYGALPRGQAYRMVDSFVKWLRTRADGRPVLAQAIFEHGHIIVNGPTLDALHRVCANVPVWSTQMTPAETSASYSEIQELVREFCRQFGGTSLLFDVFARNHGFHLATLQANAVA
ncbi:conserved protein of unknown function [Burkholderia multivorans]